MTLSSRWKYIPNFFELRTTLLADLLAAKIPASTFEITLYFLSLALRKIVFLLKIYTHLNNCYSDKRVLWMFIWITLYIVIFANALPSLIHAIFHLNILPTQKLSFYLFKVLSFLMPSLHQIRTTQKV